MKEAIKEYISKHFLGDRQEADLAMSDDILSSGMIDSMGVIQLIAFVEELTQKKIPPEDMVIENFVTINAIEDYINARKETQ